MLLSRPASTFRTYSRLVTNQNILRITSRRQLTQLSPSPRPTVQKPRPSATISAVRRYASQPPMAAPTDTQAEAVQNTTGITPDSLSQTLREKLDATHVQIDDISGGCGASFQALIVSPQFQGKTLLARSRLVNTALKAEIAAIHAWTPRCLTPEQWDKERGS